MENSRGKTAILIVVFLGAAYYGYSKYQALTPGPAINNGHSDEFVRGGRDRTPADTKRREDFMAGLNLTPEQKVAMDKLREAGPEGRERFTSFSQILTPAQRAQMDAARSARRDKGAKAALSPTNFAKYKEKEAARRGSRGGGGPRGGPGGPGGGPAR